MSDSRDDSPVRIQQKRKKSDPYTHLANCGPTPSYDIPYQPSFEQRQDGVSSFRLPHSGGGDSESGGRQTSVYYIDHKHSPGPIIQSWIDANPHMADSLSDWSIHHRLSQLGDEWREASREIFGPFEHLSENGGSDNSGGECPMCGEKYTRFLRDHLPCDGGFSDE